MAEGVEFYGRLLARAESLYLGAFLALRSLGTCQQLEGWLGREVAEE